MSVVLQMIKEQIALFATSDIVEVIKAISRALDDEFGEPGSRYESLKRKLKEAIEEWEKRD